MSDGLEKTLLLKAPLARVWKSIGDAAAFGSWFGMKIDGPFEPGKVLHCSVLDPPGFEHLDLQLVVERIEAPRILSFRWHPFAIEAGRDYSAEPMTLVTFLLQEVPGGTQLTLTESGFDALPASRRDKAFRMNDEGWAEQLERVERHVLAG